MAKQFDASGFEGPALLRPAPRIVSGAEGHRTNDDLVASPVELFEAWDQNSPGSASSTRTEEDPAVEMLEMGLLDVD